MILGPAKCSTCQHFLRVDDDGGLCRRYPPQPMVVGMREGKQQVLANKPRPIEPIIMPFFPRVGPNDVCGEFSIRVEGSA